MSVAFFNDSLSKVQAESRILNNKIGEFQELADKGREKSFYSIEVMSKYQSTYNFLSEIKKLYDEITKNMKVQEQKMMEVILQKDCKSMNVSSA